jgi:hypothetical protein
MRDDCAYQILDSDSIKKVNFITKYEKKIIYNYKFCGKIWIIVIS